MLLSRGLVFFLIPLEKNPFVQNNLEKHKVNATSSAIWICEADKTRSQKLDGIHMPVLWSLQDLLHINSAQKISN